MTRFGVLVGGGDQFVHRAETGGIAPVIAKGDDLGADGDGVAQEHRLDEANVVVLHTVVLTERYCG